MTWVTASLSPHGHVTTLGTHAGGTVNQDAKIEPSGDPSIA
jgi:hypothetical protein